VRAIWKGAVSFGLVNIPVKLYSATEDRDVSFHQVHAADGGRVRYRRVCSTCGDEVAYADVAKGYELDSGDMVMLSDADLAELPLPTAKTVELLAFVPAEQLDPVAFSKPYYLEPDKTGAKPYALLRDALDESERVGVGTIVMRQREHLAALAPSGEALVLTTMRWAYEIRSPGALDLPRVSSHERRELELALRLIDTLASDWDPRRYKDTYHDVLMQIIERKAAGEEIRAPKLERRPKIGSLVRALVASLRERRPGARSAGRRQHRRAA